MNPCSGDRGAESLVRGKPTAFGRATLKGYADPAKSFRECERSEDVLFGLFGKECGSGEVTV
jgi:hypothetical protein